jgi:hypothetical protein
MRWEASQFKPPTLWRSSTIDYLSYYEIATRFFSPQAFPSRYTMRNEARSKSADHADARQAGR